MRNRLLLLNGVLLAAIGFLVWQSRQVWIESEAHEKQLLASRPKPAPPPVLTLVPAKPPLSASSYADIAQKMLLSRDRNPTVVVETAAPPPKPMPPLPVLRGVMSFGDGPLAILAEKAGAPQRGVKIGESIGEFKLVRVNGREIAFDWDGEEVVRPLEDLMDRTPVQAQAATITTQSGAGTTVQQVSQAQSAVTSARPVSGPGAEAGAGARLCQPGDTSPVGAVVDGFRKVVTATPFGQACRWEQVSR